MSKEEDISAKDLQDDKVKKMKRKQHDDLSSVKEEEDDLECSFSPPMENKLCRNGGPDKEFPSGLVPANSTDDDQDQDLQTKRMIFKKIDERRILYEKSLTSGDVYFRRLMIPLKYGKEFLPVPEIHQGRYEMTEVTLVDHEGKLWDLRAAFDEISTSYMFFLNWDKYVKKFDLKPGDVIFIYEDPTVEEYFSIGFERTNLNRDTNIPK